MMFTWDGGKTNARAKLDYVTSETLCAKSDNAPWDGGILREKKISNNRFLRN